ncbi:MAG: bifunctional phosphoglucose/phosphomannose isomerase [Balneolaceae bacterium]
MEITQGRIDAVDGDGMWQKLCDFPKHWSESMKLTSNLEWTLEKERIHNVCFSGMGGSAIGADLLKGYAVQQTPVPVELIRDYNLPAWVDSKTLCVCCSYSGNTEETLAAFHKAREKGAQIVVITSGGKLLVEASREGLDYVKLPSGFSHRAALGHSFVPLFRLFQHLGYLSEGDEALEETADLLNRQVTLFSQFEANPALSLALELTDTLPVIYSGSGMMHAVNLRWRTQLEENAKTLSFGNQLPEMTHNEIVGWDQIAHLTGRLSVIFLQDREDDLRVQQSVEIIMDLIRDHTVHTASIQTSGNSRLARQFSLVQMGDWTSLYAALLQGTNPTPVAKIELLKSRLADLP